MALARHRLTAVTAVPVEAAVGAEVLVTIPVPVAMVATVASS